MMILIFFRLSIYLREKYLIENELAEIISYHTPTKDLRLFHVYLGYTKKTNYITTKKEIVEQFKESVRTE